MLNVFINLFQGVVTNFEIFRMREKQVPVDVVEMKGKNVKKTHKVTLIVPCRKIKDLCIICVHLSRGHHSICVGAQRQQVCRSPRRGSQNQRLLLSCEKQRQDRAHK